MKLTWSSVVICLFLAYILNSVWTLYQLWRIPQCDGDSYCLKSSLNSEETYKLLFYQSPTRNPKRIEDLQEIYTWNNFDYIIPQERSFNVSMLSEAHSNKTVFLHIVMVPEHFTVKNPVHLLSNPIAASSSAALITHMIPQKKVFNILNSEKTSNKIKSDEKPIAHWRTKIVFEIIADKSSLPTRNLPRELVKFIRYTNLMM